MNRLRNLSVAQRLTAVAVVSGLTMTILGAVAISGINDLRASSEEQNQMGAAAGMIQSLNHTAQALSTDAYLAAGLDDPTGVPDRLGAHLGELQGVMSGLDGMDLENSKLQLTEEDSVAFQKAFEDYVTTVSAFVQTAMTDQKAARHQLD